MHAAKAVSGGFAGDGKRVRQLTANGLLLGLDFVDPIPARKIMPCQDGEYRQAADLTALTTLEKPFLQTACQFVDLLFNRFIVLAGVAGEKPTGVERRIRNAVGSTKFNVAASQVRRRQGCD
jgi:hypothetical protein